MGPRNRELHGGPDPPEGKGQYPSTAWACALDHCEVSVLKYGVGYTSARNNERKNPEPRDGRGQPS